MEDAQTFQELSSDSSPLEEETMVTWTGMGTLQPPIPGTSQPSTQLWIMLAAEQSFQLCHANVQWAIYCSFQTKQLLHAWDGRWQEHVPYFSSEFQSIFSTDHLQQPSDLVVGIPKGGRNVTVTRKVALIWRAHVLCAKTPGFPILLKSAKDWKIPEHNGMELQIWLSTSELMRPGV